MFALLLVLGSLGALAFSNVFLFQQVTFEPGHTGRINKQIGTPHTEPKSKPKQTGEFETRQCTGFDVKSLRPEPSPECSCRGILSSVKVRYKGSSPSPVCRCRSGFVGENCSEFELCPSKVSGWCYVPQLFDRNNTKSQKLDEKTHLSFHEAMRVINGSECKHGFFYSGQCECDWGWIGDVCDTWVQERPFAAVGMTVNPGTGIYARMILAALRSMLLHHMLQYPMPVVLYVDEKWKDSFTAYIRAEVETLPFSYKTINITIEECEHTTHTYTHHTHAGPP